ncbi:MAG: DsbA family protein [Desulfobacterales bacterium]|nr:DsbA family protein [Desulfobacterales bacterium]
MKIKLFVFSIIALGLSFAAGVFVYKSNETRLSESQTPMNQEILVRPYSRIYGSPDVRVTIVEFINPTCGTCATFTPIAKQMVADNPGKIRLVLRYAGTKPEVVKALSMLEAAGLQGKYDQTLELMFKGMDMWAPNHTVKLKMLEKLLATLELNMDRLKTDMNDTELLSRINQDNADAAMLNARKTPAFFVNGRPLETFGREELEKLVRSELDAQY